MTITLAKVMAHSTSDLGHAFGAMARAPALFFRLELADAIVYKFTTAFVDFNITLINRKVKFKSTKAVVNL